MAKRPHSPRPAPNDEFVLPAPPVRNIILVGFMGTGKTSVGRTLARMLGWRFKDTDKIIERHAGKSIAEIFEQDGEPAFRALETEVARELASFERCVIATGGGLAVKPENRHALEAAGAVVLLTATPQTIYERTRRAKNRPLLAGPDPRAAIERLLGERTPAYDRIPIKVPTDGLAHEQVAETVLAEIEQAAAAAKPPKASIMSTIDRTVTVELGERSYPIRIGLDWIAGLGEALAPHFPPRPLTLVTNPEIGRLWAAPVRDALEQAGYSVSVCEIPPGEAHKTIDAVTQIHDFMLTRGATRQSGLIALGGGVVGDIAGFAAATLLRGVAYMQLPTSLLAMVDSSVGGKTGVNHATGKNLIGAFWQPSFVGIELKFIETLPDSELRAGMAEVIKYGVIADAAMFDYLETNIEKALGRDPEVLAHLVTRSVEIKADVVARDEREGGVRAILNYGHTFGHAAEALSEYRRILHGEGVAMGMVAAARLAAARGLIDAAYADRIERLIERAGLPTHMLRYDVEAYWRKMGADKKVRDGRIRFVLPDRPGHVDVFADVERAEVERCLEATMASQ